ncbi:MAG: zinc metallopeptidase [Sphingomonadaceae bacterium]|nr:zinc metallopeptidase [Sphingomonadaceae bacterium]
MRFDDLDPSDNTRDLGRGRGGGRGFGGFRGGGGGLGSLIGLLPMLLDRRLGCGAILLIVVVGYFVMNSGMLQLGGAPSPGVTDNRERASGQTACDTDAELFACRVLTSTEQTWGPLFQQQGSRYREPTLNFYDGSVDQTGCGAADARMGPFYCPADQGIYLDTSFFQQMESQMRAGGDAAYAYVIAHEVGHHIQYLTGTARDVRAQQQRASQTEGNQLQVRMELQADCYAGVWVARNRDRVEAGDIEEAMTAANAIGDDTLQRQAQGYVVEDSFTHGSSAQRQRWLRRGMESGDPASCDTFAARSL